MDVDGVRTLAAVHRHGTVGAAADALGYTPSAVSQQLKRLSSAIGVDVTERRGRGIALTAAGLQLVERGTSLLDQWEALRQEITTHSPVPTGTLRVGAFASSFRDITSPAIAMFHRQAPYATVHAREVDPWEAVRSVEAGYLDVAVVHNWDPTPLEFPTRLHVEELSVDRGDVLIHTSDPLSQRELLTPHDLADHPWVSVPPGTICHQWLTGLFHSAGIAPDIQHHALEWSSHVALVAQGVAVALVPRWGRDPLPSQIRAVPLTNPCPTRRAIVVWRASMAASPSVVAFVDALRAVAPEPCTV